MQKSIESDKISSCLTEMDDFLEKTLSIRKTSQSDRYNLRASLTTR